MNGIGKQNLAPTSVLVRTCLPLCSVAQSWIEISKSVNQTIFFVMGAFDEILRKRKKKEEIVYERAVSGLAPPDFKFEKRKS